MLYITLSVMIISVFALTIAYAVLSSTLTISGTTEISGSSWNITIDKYDYFGSQGITAEELALSGLKKYDNGVAAGDGELIKEPTISGTTISDAKFSLIKPTDAVVLYYTITNNGSIPAKVESIVRNTPSFSSSTNNSTDIELISNNWFSSIDLYPNANFSVNNQLDVGYILCPGETIYFEFGGVIQDTATSVSSSDITISNLGGTINFVQADKSVCSSS